jgi:prephenate dehydratase
MTNKIIAFQGFAGANSNLACNKFYPDLETKAFPTFSDVFTAVEKGEVDYGMIPLENSYAGRVSEIHNLLQDKEVSITAEHFFAVSHNLAVVKGAKLSDIKKIYSHPQALMQCSNNISNLSEDKIEVCDISNTAQAAKMVAETQDKSKAAICSEMAAQVNGLEILKKDIQDDEGNMTTFIVISKEAANPDPEVGPILTTLLFTIRNIPGSLYKSLGGFATNAVNMLKLESYIPGGISKQAKFFITIEGHPNNKNISLALEELGFFSKNVKLLGIYYADKSRFTK